MPTILLAAAISDRDRPEHHRGTGYGRETVEPNTRTAQSKTLGARAGPIAHGTSAWQVLRSKLNDTERPVVPWRPRSLGA